MSDNFGAYADAVQGASVTYLKSKPSVWRWEVGQVMLDRTLLQFGVDGGAGVVHGVTDPNLILVIMQITEFDDCNWVDGVPCASCFMGIFPAESHFTIVRTGPEKWMSWSIPKEEPLALKILPPARALQPFKTEKRIIKLSTSSASAFRSIAHGVFPDGIGSTPTAEIEGALFRELEQAWETNDGVITLPSESTQSAEKIVFRALRYVQSRGDKNVEIGDLARVTDVNYRTLLRAFERYLKISPKRYLKLRQINAVYHAIRRSDGDQTLTDIIAANGVSEFGRFAGEYRTVFNEAPSATYQRQMKTIIDTVVASNNAVGPAVSAKT